MHLMSNDFEALPLVRHPLVARTKGIMDDGKVYRKVVKIQS
jgi:hypothetical protein